MENIEPSKSARDLVVVLVLGALVYGILSYFDSFERFMDWYRRSKAGEWQLDEVFMISVILALAFGIFSFRRWTEVRQHIKKRIKTMAALVQARDAALVSTRLKSEFLANISHELRTPMNGIIGLTELTLDSGLSSSQRENLIMVRDSADRLLTLIDNLLDFSTLENGSMGLDTTEFNLRDCLDSVTDVFLASAEAKQIALSMEVSQDVPDALVGDADRFRQIVVKLTENAIKFTEKGAVMIRAEKESQEGNKLRLHLSVADTGIGIEHSQLKLIFDSFTQADGSSTRKYEGAGLGLAISSQLVALMGGKIWVESEPGKGSTFHFIACMDVEPTETALPIAPASSLCTVSEAFV